MGIEEVKNYLKKWGKDKDVLEFETSSATVELAAAALGVKPSEIAKTLSFRAGEGAIIIVAAGDVKIDNSKFKQEFGIKPKMLTPDEVIDFTGHGVGGVCPFALIKDIPVYLDISLKRFELVYPACGSSNSGIPLTCLELEIYSNCKKWVDVSKYF